MTNGTKIVIGILAVALIAVGISVGVGLNKKSQKTNANNINYENKDNIYDYLNEVTENNTVNESNNNTNENKTENNVEQNKTQNNNTETVIKNNNTVENFTGKEEQESQKENTGVSEEETAINLAKQEWGIDIDSFNFEAVKNNDGTYNVTVRGKTDGNAVTVYTINVKTGTVTE